MYHDRRTTSTLYFHSSRMTSAIFWWLTSILTVPGAWHGPEAFEPVAAILKKSGYDSVYVTLKSVGAPMPLTGYEPDVEIVQSTVQQLLDQGKDVVLVMHSYGGAPGQQAAGNLKESKGKLVRMAWVCAFAFLEGQSLIKMLGGNPLPWFKIKVSPDIPTHSNP